MLRTFSIFKFSAVAFVFLSIASIGTFVSAQEEMVATEADAEVVTLTEAEMSLIADIDEVAHVRRFFPDTSEEDAKQVYHSIVFAGEDVNDRAVVSRYLEERKKAMEGSSNIYTTVVESVSSQLVEGDIYDVSFNLLNEGPTQSGIKYRVLLRPLDSDLNVPIYKYTGEETIAVESGSSFTKKLSLTVPGYVVNGDYVWVVELGGDHGIVNNTRADLEATVISDRNVQYKINLQSCVIEISGVEQTYNLLEGVDIKLEEEMGVRCAVENTSGEALQVDVSHVTRHRSSWGKVVAEGNYEAPIQISAEAESFIFLPIPTYDTPQAYDIIFTFNSIKGEVLPSFEAHYVVHGNSATIHNVSLNQSGYAVGDEAIVSLAWSGAANNFPGSRFDESVQSLSVNFRLTDKNGSFCGEATGLKLSEVATHSLDNLKLLVIHACTDPVLETTIIGEDGEVLAHSKNNFFDSELSTTEETAIAKEEGEVMSVIVPIIGFVTLVLFILWLRKRSHVTNIVASLVLVSVAMGVSASVYAASWNISFNIWDTPAQNWSLHTATVNLSGPTGATYTGNQLITFGGGFLAQNCANIPQRSRWTVRIQHTSGGAVTSHTSSGQEYSRSWRASQFTRSGTYRGVITWEDTGCRRMLGGTPTPPPDVNDGTQCDIYPTVSEEFSFSIIAPPAIILSASPSTIDPGDSSVIRWTVTDATSCSASGGWSGSKNRNGGNETVSPAATTNYRLNCSGPGGSRSRTVTITVRPPIVTFTAAPTLIGPGNSSTLTWTSRGATGCRANGGPWSGNKSLAGNESVSPTVTTDYGLRCTGPSGTTDRIARVTLPSGTLIVPGCEILDNQSSCLSSVRWTSLNFLGTRSVRQGAAEFSTAASGNTTRPINPDDRTFTLRDNGSAYIITREATASCQQANSVWVTAVPACVPLPVIGIESNPNIVRSGNTAPVEVSILANYELTCTITGGISETFTHNPSPTTVEYNFTTNPLKSAQIVTINCVSPVHPELFGGSETRIEVIPTVQEI